MNQETDNIEGKLNGSICALLREYRKAIDELIKLLNPLNEKQLCEMVDHITNDEDCKSVQYNWHTWFVLVTVILFTSKII